MAGPMGGPMGGPGGRHGRFAEKVKPKNTKKKSVGISNAFYFISQNATPAFRSLHG